MIAIIIVAVYALGTLGCMRWLYRNAIAGGYEATGAGPKALALGWALAIGLWWPVIAVTVPAVRFVVGPGGGAA
jgi:hypothetical protein